jgi:hypothetical protein
MLNPYLLYIKIGLVALLIIVILGSYWWLQGVIKERDSLRIADAMKTSQIAQYQQAMAQTIKLQENINEAISKIRVTSNNYIKTIDNGKAPDVPDGTRIQLVSGGMLEQTNSVPTFTNTSTNSISSIHQTD